MDPLHSVAPPQKELGDDSTLPTTITVGGRTYDVLSFHEGDEQVVKGALMVERAKEMNAHPGRDDGEHLLANQGDIPVELCGKVVFVFTDWRRPDSPGNGAFICWDGDRWVQSWTWLGCDWSVRYRVLRRHRPRA